MDTAVVYMSQHGTTRKVARLLADNITGEVALFDLRTAGYIDLLPYERVIIGGSIHTGTVQKKVADFCRIHEEELLDKELGLFLCFMDTTKGQEEFENAYPEKLREHAAVTGLFGGEFLFEEMNFFERLVVKKISGENESVSKLDMEAIQHFLKHFKEPVQVD